MADNGKRSDALGMTIPAEYAPRQGMLLRRYLLSALAAVLAAAAVLFMFGPHFGRLEVYDNIAALHFTDSELESCVRRTAIDNGWADVGHFRTLRCNDPDGDGIRTLQGIDQLVSLQEVNLAFNSLDDASPLANLPHLASLDLSHNRLATLPVFRAANNIRRLEVNFNRLGDLRWLGAQDFTALQTLSLAHNEIAGIGPVPQLAELRELDLRGNHVSDIHFLRSLPGLEMLDLGGNTIADLTGIDAGDGLRRLFLDRNSITDIGPLAGLDNLEVLDIAHNHPGSLEPLASLTELQRLDIEHTDSHELDILFPLGNLEELRVGGNPGLDCASIGRAVGEFGSAAVVADTDCLAQAGR
jgi:Leucine-rich repeat (LRR) protein